MSTYSTKYKYSGFIKGFLVVLGALFISSLAVQAIDMHRFGNASLLGLVGGSRVGDCPAGMVAVDTAASFRCVDIYEASPGPACQYSEVRSVGATQENLAGANCQPVSVAGAMPWVFITREQAATACAYAGKRLPTAEEWYQFAIGVRVPQNCTIQEGRSLPTGSASECRSAAGVYDVVGNVWEWVREDIIGGQYQGRALPPAGYVQAVDQVGLPVATQATSTEVFAGAYWYGTSTEAAALMRGGFYGSRGDASVYTAHAALPATTATAGIGFRCVQ